MAINLNRRGFIGAAAAAAVAAPTLASAKEKNFGQTYGQSGCKR